MKEREVQAIKDIEKWLKESEMQKQDSLVTKGAAAAQGMKSKYLTMQAVDQGMMQMLILDLYMTMVQFIRDPDRDKEDMIV
ncbi:hypothetical protein Tco_1431318 [Tanacetum coccineum]